MHQEVCAIRTMPTMDYEGGVKPSEDNYNRLATGSIPRHAPRRGHPAVAGGGVGRVQGGQPRDRVHGDKAPPELVITPDGWGGDGRVINEWGWGAPPSPRCEEPDFFGLNT